jgi:hypothetical protein
VPLAEAGLVLVEIDVQHIMRLVLDRQMAADDMASPFGGTLAVAEAVVILRD